ncbi:MAG: hypothetical protein HW377_2051 [Actinobacteria bacterium]|nr:hypothetical protein [Actinomycetota bacterium]
MNFKETIRLDQELVELPKLIALIRDGSNGAKHSLRYWRTADSVGHGQSLISSMCNFSIGGHLVVRSCPEGALTWNSLRGMWLEEHTALLCLLLRCLRLFRLGVLLARLSRRDAPAPAVFLLGQKDHPLSNRFPVSFVFIFCARLHPQMHRLAKSRGRRTSCIVFSAILTIRSWSFFFPS